MQKDKKPVWAEIRCDYEDDKEGFWYVDAWKTDDDNEEGRVIANIDALSGRVIYRDSLAMIDANAQEIIKAKVEECRKEHPFSVVELEDAIRSVIAYTAEDTENAGMNMEVLNRMGISKEIAVFFGADYFTREEA